MSLEPVSNAQLANLSGKVDENLRFIEVQLDIRINHRGHQFRLVGTQDALILAEQVLCSLYKMAADRLLTREDVFLSLREIKNGVGGAADVKNGGDMGRTIVNTRHGKVMARGGNQQRYLNNIQRYDINFGVGPAGTGKTYLAVVCAVDALEREQVHRIILARPAVEAGERLGFLPGDLSQKIDPYLRPLYDALFEMMGMEKVTRLTERNVIEVATLAYMRGRTLNDSFIILDEAQNTTVEQMKMFLTRMGFGSTAVVTGDITQIDLSPERQSGLQHAVAVLRGVNDISFTFFESHDVVRHPLVQSVVDAYQKFNQPATDDG